MILELKDVYKNYSVTTISDTDEIIEEYRSMHGTDLSSCCTHSARDYATGGVHPCVVYGGDSGVNLVVLRDENGRMFSSGRRIQPARLSAAALAPEVTMNERRPNNERVSMNPSGISASARLLSVSGDASLSSRLRHTLGAPSGAVLN